MWATEARGEGVTGGATRYEGEFGQRLRGVNLGGWLVLERWMTPSLFDGLDAADETAWCVELGTEAAAERLRRHWASFIRAADFVWLAEHGVNAVRIPVGHWIFGPPYPYHERYGDSPHPYVTGGIEHLDAVFGWAEETGLHVVVDLHAAPGCQNGFDNGGMKGVLDWPKKPEYIEHSLDVLERIAERYGRSSALHGIEVLNEPGPSVPTPLLMEYTQRAYERIRRHCPPERVAVVFHDGFRSFRRYRHFMAEPAASNVVMDIHRYQTFDSADRKLDIQGHVAKAALTWRREADDTIRHSGLWTYVGEWSLGLDPKVVSLWDEGPFDNPLEHMDRVQQDIARRAYAAAQLLTFERYLGWFFWSYRTESAPAWSFRECVERGWLPDDFR